MYNISFGRDEINFELAKTFRASSKTRKIEKVRITS